VSAESELLKEKLESDLASAKANNIRESIRQSSMDLGHYYLDRSDYITASKLFMRTRDHCATNAHMLDFCLAVIRSYVLSQNWPMVLTYVQKADSILTGTMTEKQKQIRAQIKAVSGVAELSMSRYRQAALNFSEVGAVMGSNFEDVVSGVDVARYGVLAALASFDRTDLRVRFLNSTTFSTYTESMLEVRRPPYYTFVRRNVLI
jgi:hypothetical protein